VHGTDWSRAQQSIDDDLARLIPPEQLAAEHARNRLGADRAPVELLHRGSGWGALEAQRRAAGHEPPFCGSGLIFDTASLGPGQAPWLELLRHGTFPVAAPDSAPTAYMVQPSWRDRLETAVASGRGANWTGWLHLGVMRYHAGDRAGARTAWETSRRCHDTAWAQRALAILAREDGRHDEAAQFYCNACRLLPTLLPLAVECGRALVEANRHSDWLDLLENLPDSVRSAGRIRLLEGQAALATGDLERVAAVLAASTVIDDLREGERTLSDLWFEYHARRLSAATGTPLDAALRARVRVEFPVPPALDFRMSADPA
jgi:hypothetical protein